MNDIKKFLNKKKDEQYEFKVIATDGEHIVNANCLQEFANDWMHGKLNEGRMITRDGRVIYPANDYTDKAVKEKIIIESNIEKFNITNESLIVLKDITGLNIEDVARLLMNINNEKAQSYVETPLGRTFFLTEDNPLHDKFIHSDSFLKKINMPEGSMSLEDVVIMQDKVNNLSLVLDTRKEAVELVDMVSRSLTKNKTLNINEYYIDDMGVHEDVEVINTNVFASDSTIDLISKKLNKLVNVCKHTGSGFQMREDGFKNSENQPISKEEFYQATKDLPKKTIDTNKPKELSEETQILQKEYGLFKNQEQENEQFDVINVTKEIIARAGSKNKTFFLETTQGTMEIKEGMALKLSYENHLNERYTAINAEDMKTYTVVTDNSKKNKIPF